MSRGEDAPGVAQLREEVASLRGDVDHIRSAMQDMHREVGSAVLLLSRFVGLEWDTGEAVRLAEKRSASASDAVERLSNDVGNLEHRLAVAGEPKPENARGGGGSGGGSGSATSETVEDKLSGATSETVEDKLGGASSETVEDKISVTTSETVDDKIGDATSETVKDRLGDAAPPTTGRRDSGGAAGGGGGEGQSLQSGRPRRSSDRDPPHPRSDIQGALPRHRNDGSKGGTLAPAITTATDDHVEGAAAAAGAEGEDAGGHHLEDGPRCSGKQGLPTLSPDGEEGTLLSRRPSAGGTCRPTLAAVGRSQEGTTMAAVATVATAVAAAAAAVAVAVEPQRPDPLGDGALAPSSRALDQGESTRLRRPREVQLPVLNIADAEAGRPSSVGQGAAGAKEHGREKDKCLEGEEEGEEEEDDQEENNDREEEEEEKDVKEEDEEEKDDEEVEGEREMEGVAHPTKSGNRKSGPTPLARTGGPFSGKHGDTQRAGAGQPLVANTSPGDSESDSSGSRRRGEDDASSEFEISVGGRENSGSRKMPQDERGAAADHTKHRASDEKRSTAGDSTATPPASPPASPPVISARSNSGGGGGGDGGGGGGGRNDDDSSQTSGSWTSRSSDSRSSEQSATSTPPSSRGRGGPDREVVERGGRQSRAAAAVAAAAAAAAAGAKAAVVESVPNKDIDVDVVESGEASIHAGGRGSQNRLASKIAVDGVPAAGGPVELQGGSRMPSSSDTKAAAPTPTPRKPAPLGTRRREKREEQEEESSGDEASHTSESQSRDHRAVIAAAAAGSTEIMEPRRTAAQGMEGTGSGRLEAAAVSRNASAQSGLAALRGGGSQSVQSLVSVATPPTLLRRRGGSGSFSDADNEGATGVVGEERER